MAVSSVDIATASPILAVDALGFSGPRSEYSNGQVLDLQRARGSDTAQIAALNTAGFTARRLLMVLAASGHRLTAAQLEYQTTGAAPGSIEDAIERMHLSGFVRLTADGGLVSTDVVQQLVPPNATSMADPHAILNDDLATICRTLRIGIPNLKQERIDAIQAALADETIALRVRGELSNDARYLLDRIVSVGGPQQIEPELVGLNSYQLSAASPSRVAYRRGHIPPAIAALSELTTRGIVGLAEYDASVWVWAEAWPFVDRPFYSDWRHVEAPGTKPISVAAAPVPRIVTVVDRALTSWQSTPVPALKNDDPRISKTEVKRIAKSLSVDEGLVDLATRLAISIGLALANTAAVSGRGRKRRVDEVWMPDPKLFEAWGEVTAAQRWVRLMSEWSTPSIPVGADRIANRHLILWELARLDIGEGFADEAEFANWFEYRYTPTGVREGATECLAELRHLGAVTSSTPIALTALGRAAFGGPADCEAALANATEHATVQADLSVIAPPDLRHDLVARLDTIAVLESEAGVAVYRLNAELITKAVHDGESAETIIEFLSALSPQPLPAVVTRLVSDGASKAGSIQVIEATTVLIVTDPADLVAACAIKSTKLTPVSATVAVSQLPHAKVQAALDRKGLVADVTSSAESTLTARSSVDSVAGLERQVAQYREMAKGRPNQMLNSHIRSLEARAAALADPKTRLIVTGPLALSPSNLKDFNAK